MVDVKNYILITPAVNYPLTLAEVKDYLRVTGTDLDTQITNLIKAVTDLAEIITGRDLITKTYKGFLDCFPYCGGIRITKAKLQSLTSIQYYIDGVLTTLDTSIYYTTESETYSKVELVDGKKYPKIDFRKQAIVFNFTAGYGLNAADVPFGLRQALLSHIAYLFNNSGDCSTGSEEQYMILYKPYIIFRDILLAI